MPSNNLSDDLSRTPVFHVQVLLPDDATDGLVELGPLGPGGQGESRAVRWLGEGGAVLEYVPATLRTVFLSSEAGRPNELNSIPAVFSAQYEERSLQATALASTSTAGIWEVTF